MIITINGIREKIRRKDLYVVLGVSILIITMFVTAVGSGTMSVGGAAITDFKMLTPVLITISNLIGGAMAIALSLKTIPNEYERRTSHLVWTRGITQLEYHSKLALANISASIMSLGILYMGIGVFALIKGEWSIFIRIIPGFLIVCVSTGVVSLFTSVISIKLPTMISGVIAVAFYGIGNLHSLLEILSNVVSGVVSTLINILLVLVPNLNEIQKQGSNFIVGKDLNIHAILGGFLALYIIFMLQLLLKRKEV